jgi:hypothetical protein
MPYTVRLRRNSDGEVRTSRPYVFEFSHFWWTDGNFGCDCNRHMEFERVLTPHMLWEEHPCTKGKNAYTALEVVFENGTTEPIDRGRI